jgi:hypothetical protein
VTSSSAPRRLLGDSLRTAGRSKDETEAPVSARHQRD